jgi:UDP-N-acetylglucosamine 2-epimerase (non-hydrolysing)
MADLLCIVGARPNFMKMAPVLRALRAQQRLRAALVHTGQHYDAAMSDTFFAELGIPLPDVHLGVGNGSHAVQTAEVMKRFEPVLEANPDASGILVVGDVNSTLATALVAAKRGVKVAHVEAGLRSFDRTMPEEVNRVLTDQISHLLFTTERGARDNLRREGVADERIFFVGNVMIDTLFAELERAAPAPETLGREPGIYAVLTLHRPANVDDPAILEALLGAVAEIARRLPVIFPIHPRTRDRIEDARLDRLLDAPGIEAVAPVGYRAMLGLMRDAKLVLTDSGGIQEETTALGVPCFTLRPNTERPITIDEGTNTLVGTDPSAIRAAFEDLAATGGKAGRRPELWDGHAAERIVEVLLEKL